MKPKDVISELNKTIAHTTVSIPVSDADKIPVAMTYSHSDFNTPAKIVDYINHQKDEAEQTYQNKRKELEKWRLEELGRIAREYEFLMNNLKTNLHP